MDQVSVPDPFLKYSNYYDLLYHDKDYLAETRYVINLLNTYAPNANTLLELGCGTGNYSKHFSAAGFNITGIEKSSQMVDLAKAKSLHNFLPITGDITAFKINKKFDAVVSLFHVISYLNENESLLSCFKLVAEHLKKNGVFIFDVWYTPAVYSGKPAKTVKRVNTTSFDITRIAEPTILYEQNIVEVDYHLFIKNNDTLQYESLKEKHSMRHFSTPEIKLMAQLSGLKFVHSEEFLTAKKPGENTWGVCYILQKND